MNTDLHPPHINWQSSSDVIWKLLVFRVGNTETEVTGRLKEYEEYELGWFQIMKRSKARLCITMAF